MKHSMGNSPREIQKIAAANDWRVTGRTIRVLEGAAQQGMGLNLDHRIKYAITNTGYVFRGEVTTTAKLGGFLRRAMDGRDRSLFLLEQHAGTPFVRFEIDGGRVYGVASYEGPWTLSDPLKWVIRDLARECQRLKEMVERG